MENESTGMKGDESKLVHTGLKCSVGMLQQLTFPYVCKNHKGFYRESIRAIKPSKLASFPGLTCFYLPFVFTIIHGSGRPAKNGEGLRAFLNDIRWTPGGCGGEGGEATANATYWIICSSALPQFWTPDLSVIETTHFDR